jgi:transglutaminase-like putative cysteine protease
VVARRTPVSLSEANRLLNVFNRAIVLSLRRPRCLQYAAGAVCFLRRCGIPATLVIGVMGQPFHAHAWVELNGELLGGVADMSTFSVIDRI